MRQYLQQRATFRGSKFSLYKSYNSNMTTSRSNLQKTPITTSVPFLLIRATKLFRKYGLLLVLFLACIWLLLVLHGHLYLAKTSTQRQHQHQQLHRSPLELPFQKRLRRQQEQSQHSNSNADNSNNNSNDIKPLESVAEFLSHDWSLPLGFVEVLDRARNKKQDCLDLNDESNNNNNHHDMDYRSRIPFGNETVATLPSFGIIQALEAWQDQPQLPATSNNGKSLWTSAEDWQCQMPPTTECDEQQITVIFMAYNPDRLQVTLNQMRNMLEQADWRTLVYEVVLVWNGPRSIEESESGQKLLDYAASTTNNNRLRVVYPLKMGLTNDLMNRYHPSVVKVTNTKAILYYDDDGPFYSFAAVQAGFELWKRHSSQQLGAMSREIILGLRQQSERTSLDYNHEYDFISHCTNVDDVVEYNFRYFANYDANMVLPSGSFLHRDYLCFLWHPVLEPIRDFVRLHPVHPDDVTVSMIVSQLAGLAPKVYSRRLNPEKSDDVKSNNKKQNKQRRLSEDYSQQYKDFVFDDDNIDEGIVPFFEQQHLQHRKLLFGIDWDAGHNMNDAKQYWADLRTEAVNALVRYFGSINAGSIGWCENTQYYDAKTSGKCNPVMAKIGWLPWMNPDGSPKSTCP